MEEMYAKSGDRILQVEGRYLCSKVDPVTEARRWVDRARDQIAENQAVIILGLGAGYHVSRVCRQFPNKKVLVFERNKRCRQFAERLFPMEFFDLPVLSSAEPKSLAQEKPLKRVLSGRFCILEHSPSMELNRSWYEELKATLLGRNIHGLRLHLQTNQGFQGVQKQRLLWLNQNPVNWRVFDPMMEGQLSTLGDQDFFIFKTLRELIK